MAKKTHSADDALIRKLENDLSRKKMELSHALSMRKEAEKEVHRLNSSIEDILDNSDDVTLRKIDRMSRKPGGQSTAIICANDWHCEEKIDPDVIDGCNEFDLTIAKRRIEKTWQKAVFLIDSFRKFTTINDIVLWLGGDMVNGAIHEELEESNFLGPTEAVLWMQEEIASGIEFLKKEAGVKNIIIPTSYGNHGRTTKKRRLSTGHLHNWEWLTYNNLAAYYRKDPKVHFKVEKGYFNWLTVQGRDVRFHHGDNIKFGGGVGGVHIPLRKKIAQWNKQRVADLDICGHFHQFISDWKYVVSGCLCGYNAYALAIGAEYQVPTQTFILMSKKYGNTITCPIFCDG